MTTRDGKGLPPSHVPLRVVASNDDPSRAQAAAGGGEYAPPDANLDEVDVRLLRLLQDDGRMPNARMAETVGLSPAATYERVRRLTREGFILGYEAVLNPEQFGGGMLAFAEVRVEAPGRAVIEAFKAAMQVHGEILECHQVAGSFDYLIKARVADMRAYSDLVTSVVWTLPGVRDVRTYVVIEEVKSTSRIPF